MGMSEIVSLIDSLDALEFYECNGELNCRVWNGFKSLHRTKMALLVEMLNEAIDPVRDQWLRNSLDDLSSTVSRRCKSMGLVDESLGGTQ